MELRARKNNVANGDEEKDGRVVKTTVLSVAKSEVSSRDIYSSL